MKLIMVERSFITDVLFGQFQKPYNLFNKEGKLGGGLKYVFFVLFVLRRTSTHIIIYLYIYYYIYIDMDVLAIVCSENSLYL